MSWIQTRSGRGFDLTVPRKEDVALDDIAFALSRLNRFTGHAGDYSVAQHSVLVALQLPEHIRIYGLLHDAHEAYIGDISTPLKAALSKRAPGFDLQLSIMEHDISTAIYAAAGIDPPNRFVQGAVKFADVTAMMTEARDLLGAPPRSWGEYDSVQPLAKTIEPQTADTAAFWFKYYLDLWLPVRDPQSVAA